MKQKTCIIIDDHPLYRSGISALVREGLGLECIGEAGSLQEGRQLLDTIDPNRNRRYLPALKRTTHVNDADSASPHKILAAPCTMKTSMRTRLQRGNGYLMKQESPDDS
jgi:two-component system nitrate/nitrite response regulator NarL